jgi:RNA polymerase sigma factor (sigma-70 family)
MAIGSLSHFLRHFRRRVAGCDTAHVTDAELLRRFASGRDEAAFAALVQRHGPLVLGVCRRVLRHEDSAEDAFQAAFLVLARKAGSLARPERLANWLYGVARRVALKARTAAVRRWARQRQMTDLPASSSAPQTDRDELSDLVDEELQRLPGKFRAPLMLCCLQGLTREEAAAQLGCSAGAVKGMLERGRETLRERLTRRGVTLSAGALVVAVGEDALRAAVPAALRDITVEGATIFAAGPLTAVGSSAALAREVLRAMWITRAKVWAAVLCLIGLTAVGAGAVAYAARTGEGTREPSPPAPVAAPDKAPAPEKAAGALSFAITGAYNRVSNGDESWGYCDGCALTQDGFPVVCFGLNQRPGKKARYLYLILFKAGPQKPSSQGAEGNFRGSADGAEESMSIRFDDRAIDLAYQFEADPKTHALVRESLKVGDMEVKDGDSRVFLVDLTQAKVTYRPVRVALPDAVPNLNDGEEKKTWGPTLLRAIEQLEEKSPEIKKFRAPGKN